MFKNIKNPFKSTIENTFDCVTVDESKTIPDHLIKIIIIGDSGSGKSSLIYKWCDVYFCSTYTATIGVDFKMKMINIDGKNIKLYIWDTAGQERFKSIIYSYYRGVDGIILVYDVSNMQSLLNTKSWIRDIDNMGLSVPILLVGNKNDLKYDKSANTTYIKQMEHSNVFDHIEISVKNNNCVNQCFATIIRQILNSNSFKPKSNTPITNTITLDSELNKKDNSKCC